VKLDVGSSWASGEGPEADVVVSTRARLARNLAGKVFPGKASAEDLAEIAGMVRRAAAGLESRFEEFRVLDVDELQEADREYLVDARVASYEQVDPREGRLIILNSAGSIAIMVNEEDHLRIQAILSGLQPTSAWELVDEVDSALSRFLQYEYSDRYGYLTASLSNVGTGLRVSTMLHLAGLCFMGSLARTLRAAYDLGISVRGLFGEGSSGLGDFYQVSNEVTLGLPEPEIVCRVRGVADYLINEERRARRTIADQRRDELAERARGAMDKLRRAKTVRAEEALALLSPVRMAASLGMIEGGGIRLFNELLINMGIGRLTSANRVSWDAVRMEMTRAPRIKAQLAELTVKTA